MRFVDEPSVLGLKPETAAFDDALLELKSQGYAVLPWQLSDDLVTELQGFLYSCPGKFAGDDIVSSDGSTHPLSAQDWRQPRAEKFSIASGDLLQHSLVRDLALDGGLLSLARDYLQATPRLDIASAWFSFPVGRSSNVAATEFHYDLDRTKWIKVFIFLSEVNEDTGAHIFVPATHRDGGIPKPILNRGYARIPDLDVDRFFPRSDWATIGGPRGTILIEDTRGLHKGKPLVKDHRLLLQFQYSQNLFGTPSSLSKIPRKSFLREGHPLPGIFEDVLEAFTND